MWREEDQQVSLAFPGQRLFEEPAKERHIAQTGDPALDGVIVILDEPTYNGRLAIIADQAGLGRTLRGGNGADCGLRDQGGELAQQVQAHRRAKRRLVTLHHNMGFAPTYEVYSFRRR